MNESIPVVSEPDQKQVKEDAATRWRKLLEQQRASGLSVSAFCRERGVGAASMFAWRRRLARGAAMFKPVKIAAEPVLHSQADAEDSTIELCLPGQRRLIVRRGFDRRLLVDLLEVLAPVSLSNRADRRVGPEARS